MSTTGPYDDLRSFIEAVDDAGELVRLDGVDRDLEIGALTEAVTELLPGPPMVLFDRFAGFPVGHRVVTGVLASPRRVAMTLGLDPDLPSLALIREVATLLHGKPPIPPAVVSSGPILENVLTGSSVDMTRFPASLFAALNGGRYIGTGCSLLNRDPESGYVNLGTYRMQVHEPDLLGLWMSPGQNGRTIAERYWSEGKACPVVATFGGDPLTFLASAQLKLPWGSSELDFIGGIKGRPVDVVTGPYTGLPIPASCEIAIEGEVPPPTVESREEGPFGEWPGYYSGGSAGVGGEAQPVIRIKAMYHRNDPILDDETPLWPGAPRMGVSVRAGFLWEQLEAMGIDGVVGVDVKDTSYLVVVAISQRYPGHARQVALAALSCSAVARHGRYVVVVDDDIDPTNMREVLWALETRVEPTTDIDIVRGLWSTPLDPTMPLANRASRDYTAGRAVFLAVRPYAERDSYPKVARSSRAARAAVLEKYAHLFRSGTRPPDGSLGQPEGDPR
jgi:UbiD family decarboxylase